MEPVYLDNNATTPLLPEVVDAMLPYLREHFGNPSSGHVYGRRAREAVERARQQVASLIGASPHEIIFTSGGTEATNLALRGRAQAIGEPGALVTSAIEHPATSETCDLLGERGWTVDRVAVTPDGWLDLESFRESFEPATDIVTLMHANNETGVLQPVSRVAQLAKDRGATVHTDAAQSIGKVPVDVGVLDVDLMTIAGHKFHAPKGVGALYLREGLELEPVLRGASHEGGLRPGTENVASVVGLGAAAECVADDLETAGRRMKRLRDQLWDRLSEAIPDLNLNGHPSKRLPNTLNVRFPDVTGDQLLSETPEVAASTGAACHDDQLQASAGILALGIPERQALGSVRLSLGRTTTESDIDTAVQALRRAWRGLQD